MAAPSGSTPSFRRDGVVDAGPAAALAGVLGVDAPDDLLPPMWHTVYLLDRWRRDELGIDGHPLQGMPTPPREPHRRMFAGGRSTHLRPLRLGDSLSRTSEVVSSTEKEGRSGRLLFVTVQHEYRVDDELAVVDEQDIVYRPPDAGGAAPAVRVTEPERLAIDREFAVDEVVLFQFSSVTANAHRIHYDLPYARTEGHAELVIHGPLQVLLMMGALTGRGLDVTGARFSYRLLAPARGAQTLTVGRPDAGDADVVVCDAAGTRVARGELA